MSMLSKIGLIVFGALIFIMFLMNFSKKHSSSEDLDDSDVRKKKSSPSSKK